VRFLSVPALAQLLVLPASARRHELSLADRTVHQRMIAIDNGGAKG
jgi:hypothetical protein